MSTIGEYNTGQGSRTVATYHSKQKCRDEEVVENTVQFQSQRIWRDASEQLIAKVTVYPAEKNTNHL